LQAALSIMHLPVPRSQNCPAAQVTPAQASLAVQMTPGQGSLTVTQVALQLAPPPQAIPFALAHGSVWQLPPKQNCPAAQGVGQPVAPLDAPVVPAPPRGVEQPQPIMATNSASPMARLVRSAALRTDRRSRDVLVMVPPEGGSGGRRPGG
jgi:hypothetical protein